MQLDNIFPSKYIKASDLQGRMVTVVISRAVIEKMGDDQKLVLYFQGKEKGLVTNKTNAQRIGNLYGGDTDNWIGREIVLYGDLVPFQGKQVDAIRVRAPEKINNAFQPRPGSIGTELAQALNRGLNPPPFAPVNDDEPIPF